MKKMSFGVFMSALFVLTISPAQATLITYAYNGPNFNSFINNSVYTTSDKTTGFVTFDSSLLSLTGNGSIRSNSFGTNQFTAWAFEDGYNNFANDISSPYGFTIFVNFQNFMPNSWIIDATHGHTLLTDIFERGSTTRYHSTSYHQNSRAFANNNVGQPWSRVPEPATLSLIAGGFLLMGFAARRRQKNV